MPKHAKFVIPVFHFKMATLFNIHELDAASNNLVEDIRSLIEQVRIPPQAGRYKIYIIDEVHMLSQAAFNAFLKTLEEPLIMQSSSWLQQKSIKYCQPSYPDVRSLILTGSG